MAIGDDDGNWYYGDNRDEEVVCDTKDGEDDGNGDEEDGDEGQVQALGLLCNGAGAGAAFKLTTYQN